MANYKPGTKGTEYQPNTYNELGDMIGTVAFQLIREVTAKDPLMIFDKMPIKNGDTIEQAVALLVEASPFDRTGATTLDRITKKKLEVRLFNNWERETYSQGIDINELRKVLLGDNSAENVASKLINVLSQSDIHARFEKYKALLKWGTTTVSGGNASVLKALPDVKKTAEGGFDYKAILKQIKDTVKGMSFVNANYNTANVKRRTFEDDIIIVMPYTLVNAIDVDELAGVFNLDKAEIRNKIVEIDATDNIVYIVDKNAILGFTREYEMLVQANAQGAFWNYFLHVERLYAISPLFDACFFKYDANNA